VVSLSVKYERIKQQDMALPGPIRWLTRAFSSVTLAVILLTLVALYGLVASVPLGYLAKLGTVFLCAALPGLAIVFGYRVLTGKVLAQSFPTSTARWFVALTGVVLAGAGAVAIGWQGVVLIHGSEWYKLNQATVVYRLPFFEMTEQEFYGWWPMKAILGLFVVNMSWATIRRIEFKFVNIGVLTVHVGIVMIATGSIFYNANKLEGDALLWRQDIRPGAVVNRFYDASRPALYFLTPTQRVMVDLPTLPRYNDYPLGQTDLSISLDDAPGVAGALGPNVEASINGFIAYGTLESVWVDAARRGEPVPEMTNPAVIIAPGTRTEVEGDETFALIASLPAKRVVEGPRWALEFVFKPIPQFEKDWAQEFKGPHGLVVEIPGKNFYQVYSVQEGQTIKAGDTGYTINVEKLGDYGMPFVTAGYQGATDTRAQVVINDGSKEYRRIAMHRYPERTQDFIPAPDDPTAGPMGKRVAPNPAIRVQYLDATKAQFRLIASKQDLSDMALNVRLPDTKPFQGKPDKLSFPIGSTGGQDRWLHVVKTLEHAVEVAEPTATPKTHRVPKDEGTLVHALVPVTFNITDPANGKKNQKTVWLSHMRYPEPDMAAGMNKPEWIDVPGVGRVGVIFSRRAYTLPFSIKLDAFEMQAYEGSDIPRDYISKLTFTPINLKGAPIDEPFTGETRLNNPYIARTPYSDFEKTFKGHGLGVTLAQYIKTGTLKVSQTGWDPGDKTAPNNRAKNEQGLFINQQRYSILGISNNVAIQVIFIGAVLIALGIPWAFYLKPWLLRRERDRIKASLGSKV
jgi:hypothetical protein